MEPSLDFHASDCNLALKLEVRGQTACVRYFDFEVNPGLGLMLVGRPNGVPETERFSGPEEFSGFLLRVIFAVAIAHSGAEANSQIRL
jgi:hypothetical protein